MSMRHDIPNDKQMMLQSSQGVSSHFSTKNFSSKIFLTKFFENSTVEHAKISIIVFFRDPNIYMPVCH